MELIQIITDIADALKAIDGTGLKEKAPKGGFYKPEIGLNNEERLRDFAIDFLKRSPNNKLQ